jgi:cell division septal protein FtsQ
MLSLLMLLSGAMIATRHYPKIDVISITGNVHHAEVDVLQLANVVPGDPFLWLTSNRVMALASDPWVQRVSIARVWPNEVHIDIAERQAALLFHDAHGAHVYAYDGTLLYGVSAETQEALVTVQGWGDVRLAEALQLHQLLADYGLRTLAYSPYGFDIELANGRVFTPSVEDLRTHWAGFGEAISDAVAREESRLAVYPWGVSVSHGR